MSVIVALGLTSFLLCLFLTPIVRDAFLRMEVVDQPDAERKLHLKATPRVGGISIMFAYVGSLAFIFFIAPPGLKLSVRHGMTFFSLLPATGVIFMTGLIDDLIVLKPWQKLLGQSLAAGIAIYCGIYISIPHGPVWLAMSISFVWLLASANGLNLIDGMDGLAAGVALFATGSMFLMAAISGNLPLVVATVPLAGCLVAFLSYNFHPASIFLGDCGSLTVGFMLGCFGLAWSQHAVTPLGLAAPLVALSLPLLDIALAIGRRFIRDTPIFKGDRQHIHHKVLARFTATWKATLILYGTCVIASLLAIMLSVTRHPRMVCLIFCALVLVGIGNLRYVEIASAVRAISYIRVLRLIREEIYLRDLERMLAKATTVDMIWEIALAACDELEYETLKMKLCDRSFDVGTEGHGKYTSWSMSLPLGPEGELVLSRRAESSRQGFAMAVLGCLQSSIVQKSFTDGLSATEQDAFSYMRDSPICEKNDSSGGLSALKTGIETEISNGAPS